ncbi:MAG: GNAT family N-acetyltransferase [Rhodospirillales bacterium]|nr:GNAT family N-acetyltransferase [Rhodospirillales bacterium]
MERIWRVREAGPGDLDLIRELYRAVRGENRPEAYDRWRYLASPHGPAPGTLAVADNRAVGFYTLWPTPLKIGSASVAGAQSMDTMTHPDFRGQGIFVALARACFDLAATRGVRLLYGFPNRESFPGFVRRLEWTHAGGIPHWIRPVRPSRHPHLPAPLGLLADAAVALWPAGRLGGYEVAVAPADPAHLAVLAEENAAGVCRVERASAWFAWRYASAAAQGYESITAVRGGTVRAAAVWGMKDDSWGASRDGRAHLVELSGADPAAREAALAQVISRARDRGAWLLETVTNAPEAIRTLRRAGFVAHRSAPLIVRALGPATFAPDPFKVGNWRINGGDLDTF